MRPLAGKAETVAGFQCPDVAFHVQLQRTFHHHPRLFPGMGEEILAGKAAGGELHEVEIEPEGFVMRGQHVLVYAGAPQVHAAALGRAYHKTTIFAAAMRRAGGEQAGKTHAEGFAQRHHGAQRRRGKPPLDLAEIADRIARALGNLHQ